MSTTDPRIDAYIDKAAGFAQPVLRHIREVVHEACPDVEETIKWGMPHFTRKGIVCGMVAFKQHCALGFWKEKLIFPENNPEAQEAMGQFGHITAMNDLPSRKDLIAYVREAVRLNEEGVKAPKAAKSKRPEPPMPDAFRAALDAHPEAATVFEGFSPSHRREYIEWIAEAKREATRNKRISTAIEWIGEGKPRNWKYMKRGS